MYIRKCNDEGCASPGAWTLAGTNTSVYGANTLVTFNYNSFGEDAIYNYSGSKWQYKFNVTDFV